MTFRVNNQKNLNTISPATARAKLGDVIYDLIGHLNATQADLAALSAKHTALLAHLDAANVTGIGTTNAASFAAPAATGLAVLTPDQR